MLQFVKTIIYDPFIAAKDTERLFREQLVIIGLIYRTKGTLSSFILFSLFAQLYLGSVLARVKLATFITLALSIGSVKCGIKVVCIVFYLLTV